MFSVIFGWLWWPEEVPNDWKIANITSFFKQGEKKDPGNYWLVSLTSVPGKVMEHLILEVISIHMEDKKVVRSSQHEFTREKSRLSILIVFYDVTTTWMDEGRAVDAVYLDFTKAFNTVPHNIPIGKLRKY